MGVVGTVVDAAVGWVVQAILEKLLNERMEEWTSKAGLRDDVENLTSQIRSIDMLLCASREWKGPMHSGVLARSLEGLRPLVYDAEDLLDELDYYRLQQVVDEVTTSSSSASSSVSSSSLELLTDTASQIGHLVGSAFRNVVIYPFSRKRKRTDTTRMLYNMFEPFVPLENKDDISHRIKEIVDQLEKVSEGVFKALNLEKQGCHIRVTQNERTTMNKCKTTSYFIEPNVFGRDMERDRIVQLLRSEQSRNLSVLPIVGNGGIGKTTLARYVYNDQRVKSHFGLQMWICVSHNFDEVRLSHEMLDCISKDMHRRISNFNRLQVILEENIKSQRFLLVLDDMWEDKDMCWWDRLLAPLKCGRAKGSMILVTTQNLSFARMVCTIPPIRLDGLKEDKFWSLFKEYAFGHCQFEVSPNLQIIGREIAGKLKGYPLAAKSVGALLNRELSEERWRRILETSEWKSLQQNNGIMAALMISYDYLPFHLQ